MFIFLQKSIPTQFIFLLILHLDSIAGTTNSTYVWLNVLKNKSPKWSFERVTNLSFFLLLFFFNPKTSFSPRHPIIPFKKRVKCVCMCVYILYFFKSDLFGMLWNFFIIIFFSFSSSCCCCCASCACKNIQTAFFFSERVNLRRKP